MAVVTSDRHQHEGTRGHGHPGGRGGHRDRTGTGIVPVAVSTIPPQPVGSAAIRVRAHIILAVDQPPPDDSSYPHLAPDGSARRELEKCDTMRPSSKEPRPSMTTPRTSPSNIVRIHGRDSEGKPVIFEVQKHQGPSLYSKLRPRAVPAATDAQPAPTSV